MSSKILIVEDELIVAKHLQRVLERSGHGVCGIAKSVAKAQEIISKENPNLILVDIYLQGIETGIDLARQLRNLRIPFIYLSANSNEDVLTLAKKTEPYGFLVKPFREKDLLIAIEIARYRHEQNQEASLKSEIMLEDKLMKIMNEPSGWEKDLSKIMSIVQPYFPFDFAISGFNSWIDGPYTDLAFVRTGFDEYQILGMEELLRITGVKRQDFLSMVMVPSNPHAAFYNGEEFDSLCAKHPLMNFYADAFHVEAMLVLPIEINDRRLLNFSFFSKKPTTYIYDHLNLFDRVKPLWSRCAEELTANEKKKRGTGDSHNTIPESKRLLQQLGFDEIVGNSHLLLSTFDLVAQVAPSNTSVLLLGESGTGKERIADCIHNLSPRRDKPFIKLNCTTLPATLIESELFGHEKGAFTGATEKRIGKFEQADRGTIFLDEIGELPTELQVKLLRVLQEKEINRIGSSETIKVNVRVIAATNRSLEKEVAEGRFRLDLYYRLNVFPIMMPPLRDRKEDIPLLVAHFIQRFSQREGKNLTGISDKALGNLMEYHWPGNVRELENVIERAALLTKCNIINDILIPYSIQHSEIGIEENARLKTMEENERDHIIAVLNRCHGKIWGTGGAAEILNLPPSTLKSKMKKLGIKKEFTSPS